MTTQPHDPPPYARPGGFPVVGVVGGGQLARMMQPPAVALGVRLQVLAESPAASAAQVINPAPLGAADDLDALRRFAAECDAVTFDHEHVPTEHLRALQEAGASVQPGPDALVHAQDKIVMRRRLTALGVPCPRWAEVADAAGLRRFGDETGWPVVLKTPRGGYDGKGVLVVDGPEGDWRATADAWWERGPLLAEERVDFTRELAALVARSPSGQAAAWPVVQTVQAGGVCREVVAPAPDLDPGLAAGATDTALRIAEGLGVTGVLAVEMFEVQRDGRTEVLVNELAMRPHNSGHWSIDGSVTSQFEQHLRAVLDLPLGDPRPRAPWTVMVNVLGRRDPEPRHLDLFRSYLHVMAHDPAVKVHLYGKEQRAGRKLGHVTAYGDDLDAVLDRARHAAAFIAGEIDA
ncbi:5-(carboxyamino)imidazole ribonucleotide synthase [Kineococcus xinjiangensis]|uniref:N5-carboxyaminoimidazole ribonucleotide synthase n=1 Tax=Kineococcus xinjiangensis TaxID=512762 RepID=A0A2S6IUA0_9ACTN|nr:5-(carboxyamino)imidazole ribonucleotide synthase [Kineococcus xinjiangensis]PPK97715.1 5-(carboxyamino)imidazole ribonucleotide synthase [Kineococcus xinjiangensis]